MTFEPDVFTEERLAVSAQTSNPCQEFGQKETGMALPFRTAAEIERITPSETLWVLKNYWPLGCVIEVGGKVKLAGKTTWVTCAARKVLDGLDFMGLPTMRSPVVYLTEQTPSSWRVSMERAGLSGREDLYCLFAKDTRGLDWNAVMGQAAEKCKSVGAKLLVIDTLGQFIGMSGDSENDAAEALVKMRPLQAAAGEGLCVVYLRHERKSGGLVGESGRGSSGYAGASDVVLSIRRPEGNHRSTVRTIQAIGRFDETPEEMTVEFIDGTYVALGAVGDVEAEEAASALLTTAPTSETEAVELKALIDGSKVSRATAQRAVKNLCAANRLSVIGKGKRGDPFRYFLNGKVSAQTSNTGFGGNGQKPAWEHQGEVVEL